MITVSVSWKPLFSTPKWSKSSSDDLWFFGRTPDAFFCPSISNHKNVPREQKTIWKRQQKDHWPYKKKFVNHTKKDPCPKNRIALQKAHGIEPASRNEAPNRTTRRDVGETSVPVHHTDHGRSQTTHEAHWAIPGSCESLTLVNTWWFTSCLKLLKLRDVASSSIFRQCCVYAAQKAFYCNGVHFSWLIAFTVLAPNQ